MKYGQGKTDIELEELCTIHIENATSREPIKAKALRHLYGRATGEWVAVRRVQEAIRELRLKGLPICANGEGYYWPHEPDELKNYVECFERRVRELNKALKALKESTQNANIEAEAVIESE